MVVTLPTALVVVGAIALVLVSAVLLAGMFGPTPQYKISSAADLPPNDSPEFLDLVEALTDAKVNRTGTFEVLANGPNFYAAELDAMRSAQRSINLEAYIFQKSEIGSLYLEAM